jgi:hypothetical protein
MKASENGVVRLESCFAMGADCILAQGFRSYGMKNGDEHKLSAKGGFDALSSREGVVDVFG